MAYLAMRGCGSVNGVSRLHGEVSRQLFSPLFPRWPVDEVPIGHVTNGVHHPTWDSAAADELWTKACGKDRWLGMKENLEQQDIRRVDDESLWQLRADSTKSWLITHASAWPGTTPPPEPLRPPWKRRNISLIPNTDPRFCATICHLQTTQPAAARSGAPAAPAVHPQRPVQLMIAGKAHPADLAGQALIQQWISVYSPAGSPSACDFSQ